MDTTEDPRVLPSARSLMLHVQDHPSSTQNDTTEKMQIDTEDALKPRLGHGQPCSPIPHGHASDEYLRHRMSDMTVSPTSITPQSQGGAMMDMHESSRGTLSPLEPTSQQQQQQTAPYGRRESITDPLMFRRPSITDLNNLPLPSASSSRRGSMATSTDYDYSSRSPSPSPFKPSSSSDYARPDAYDPFQRRHSIATAEIPHGSTTRLASSKYRAFRFPATIPEAPGHYSAPSSPPHDQPVAANTNTNTISAGGSALARSNMHHHYHQQQHQYRPTLHHSHRRRSLLTEEGPVIARRASMPVVGYVEPPPPPTSSQDKPMRKSETPYSRSPELRVSHKLAERKRRKEMKELFDELRDSLPVEKNLKTSKWEILSKAVEYISLLKRRDYDMESETNALRREINMLRRERGLGNAGYGHSSSLPY